MRKTDGSHSGVRHQRPGDRSSGPAWDMNSIRRWRTSLGIRAVLPGRLLSAAQCKIAVHGCDSGEAAAPEAGALPGSATLQLPAAGTRSCSGTASGAAPLVSHSTLCTQRSPLQTAHQITMLLHLLVSWSPWEGPGPPDLLLAVYSISIMSGVLMQQSPSRE